MTPLERSVGRRRLTGVAVLRRSRSDSWPSRHRVLTAGAAAAVIIALIPVAYLVVRTAEYSPAVLLEQLGTPRMARLASTSLALVAASTALCLVVGTTLAVLVTRTRLPGRKALAVAAALPLAIPSYVAAFGWSSLSELVNPLGTFEGFGAAVFVISLVSYPYVYLPVCAALLAADPAQEDAARSLGLPPVSVFVRITARQILPATASGALLCALYILSDFGAVSILRVDTFTRAVFTSFSLGFDRLGAVSLSSVLLALTVLVLLVEGRFRRTKTRYAKLGPGSRRPADFLNLGRFTAPVVAASWLVVAVAVGGPLAALALWSFEGVSRPGSLAELGSAFLGSVSAAGAAALFTTVLATPLGLMIAGSRSRIARLMERLIYLAHSLPGIVVGLSVVYLGINLVSGLYQTQWLLTLAYGTLFLPLAVGPIVASALLTPPQVEEAAQSLGAAPLSVFFRISLPMALPGVAAGALMVLLTAIKELPATLMLRPTGFETLATRLWTYTSVESYSAAAPYAALLVVLAITPTWILVARVFKEPK
ncbi:iron ABC transporter permease [Pseudarthrobacter sp. J64]|uniref:ABC transporter permease n=1 Tax=Pseudarthrobacter sp. J64 TaxID=3116485 RepID=UPI002E808906|nr:iron ABC transporter permease [Pseudarthrobacter sp. J64]MEE2570985.1 iron ABC transporter permease [Pseudarthrobacter sp. J64]